VFGTIFAVHLNNCIGRNRIVNAPLHKVSALDTQLEGDGRKRNDMTHILLLVGYRPLRHALNATLRRTGWQVDLAQTDQETLQALDRQPYDVIVVDMDMATGDSRRVLRALRTLPNPPPVVALMNPESPSIPGATTLGACVILYKTVGRQALLNGIQTALQASSSEAYEE
jgi:DNA-binding response OmpR family regulator